MKISHKIFAPIAIAAVSIMFFACEKASNPPTDCDGDSCESSGGEPFRANNPVECYGKLQTSGNKLVGSKTGDAHVQVRGISLGWSNTGWESARFFTEATVDAMVDQWKAEIIRAPLGIGGNGYLNTSTAGVISTSDTRKQANKDRVTTVIDKAIQKGAYAIIDWHSHSAHLAAEQQEAITFFREMAQRYGHLDNIIFEIYNEPLCENGGNPSCTRTTWAQIKSYAQAVISAIREHSSNLIIVGTPSYCQRIDEPVNDPINDSNVAYVLHFYAAEHNLEGNFRNRLTTALDANLPVFISEYGTTSADGGQPGSNTYNSHNTERADIWHQFMDENKISSAAWNVNDKNEGSAFFGLNPKRQFNMSSWTDQNQMTASGQYIYNKLNGYYNAGLPWHNCEQR